MEYMEKLWKKSMFFLDGYRQVGEILHGFTARSESMRLTFFFEQVNMMQHTPHIDLQWSMYC